jgi:hypothetical protein
VAPPSASVNENASLVFSTANANAINVTDTGAGTNLEQLTLVATHGVLNLASTSGLTFTSGTDGSSSMTVQATLANLNVALDALKFTPALGYSGPAPLSVTYEDPALNQMTSATTAISVVVPASRPTVKIQAPLQAIEGIAVPFKFLVSDTNPTAQAAAFRFGISFGDGTATKTVTAKSPLQLSHVFTRAGTFKVTVVVIDEYGHKSAPVSVAIKVVPVPILPAAPDNQAASQVPATAMDETAISPDSFAIPGNPSADADNELIRWAGLSAAMDILNDWDGGPWTG